MRCPPLFEGYPPDEQYSDCREHDFKYMTAET